MRKIVVTVNGVEHAVDVEPRQLLVYFLREQLGLTGTNRIAAVAGVAARSS